MLNVNNLEFPDNLLLVSQHPVAVAKVTEGGIQRPQDEIEREAASRQIRFGTIIAHGNIDANLQLSLPPSLRGEKDLSGSIIMFINHHKDLDVDIKLSHIVDGEEVAIERPFLIHANYITATVVDNK